MSIVVEDGTGLTTATSYISRDDADAYHAARGNTDWAAASEEARDQALISATQWLDNRWRGRWLGLRLKSGQALAWPRSGATDRDGFVLTGVPKRIPYAVAEVALAVVQGVNLSPVLKRGGAVRRKRVGPIETEYFGGAPARDVITAATDLIRGYVRGPGLRMTV